MVSKIIFGLTVSLLFIWLFNLVSRISHPLLVKFMVSMISSMGPMACPFSNKCWAKLDFPFLYLKSRRCS